MGWFLLRRNPGWYLTLFGHAQYPNTEMMPTEEFGRILAKCSTDGASGEGRGLALVPSKFSRSRRISDTTLANYETILRLAMDFVLR